MACSEPADLKYTYTPIHSLLCIIPISQHRILSHTGLSSLAVHISCGHVATFNNVAGLADDSPTYQAYDSAFHPSWDGKISIS